MKFAIDPHIEVALNREYQDKAQARLDDFLNPENWYYMVGEADVVPMDLAVPTALARPTLTTSQNLDETVKTPK